MIEAVLILLALIAVVVWAVRDRDDDVPVARLESKRSRSDR